MDYKEKLKAIINSNNTPFVDIYTFLKYFPELKESEDEKIRKEILDYIIKGSESLYDVQQYGKEKFEKWISWLEKQGEKLAGWSEEDKDMIYKIRNMIFKYAFSQSAVDVNGDLCEKEYIEADGWMESLKDRVQPQHKQGWSEENNKKISYLIALLQNCTMNDDALRVMNEEVESWLKSLRPQSQWKPSDEQMKAFWEVYKGGEEQAALASLYSDLKKLREE